MGVDASNHRRRVRAYAHSFGLRLTSADRVALPPLPERPIALEGERSRVFPSQEQECEPGGGQTSMNSGNIHLGGGQDRGTPTSARFQDGEDVMNRNNSDGKPTPQALVRRSRSTGHPSTHVSAVNEDLRQQTSGVFNMDEWVWEDVFGGITTIDAQTESQN